MFESVSIKNIVSSMPIKACLSSLSDLEKKGYFVIKDHTIDIDLIKTAYEYWTIYFSKEIVDKKHGLQKPAGYYDYWAEDQAFQKIGIPKASFYFNKKTILSSDYDDLQIVTLKLFNELSLLAKVILEALSDNLSEYVKKSIKSIQKYDETLRIIHSPAIFQENELENNNLPVRNRAHEDIDILTLLPSATVPGLQYLCGISWETVQYEFGDIIVNAGDALNLLSNGIIKSPTHRVVALDKNVAESERFSMAYFLSIA